MGKRFAQAGYHAVLCRRSNEEGLQTLVAEIESAGGSASGYILNAVEDSQMSGLVIYPNSDPGHMGIIAAIKKRETIHGRSQWSIAKSIPRSTFLRYLKSASVIVGNSSCGIIEASFAGIPTVNIGSRQLGRLRNPKWVLDCTESRKKIKAAMEARFKKADKDVDGKLSRDEVSLWLEKRFSKIDADADGQLTREELKAAFRAYRKDASKKGCPKGKKKDKKKEKKD